MPSELIVCIPGKWADRSELVRQVIAYEPKGRYMFAGLILADMQASDHVTVDFCEADERIPPAFSVAGQGAIGADVIAQLDEHRGIVYLHFPLDLLDQRERILKFTQIFQRLGGIAVKLESSGVAHTWERWFKLLSGSLFDIYCASVVLTGDEEYYYSCGMHHFGLPECEVTREIPVDEVAELMNRFNFWQIADHPTLAAGHTFSLTADAPHFRLSLRPDPRHGADDLFCNPQGIWRLEPI